MTRIPPRMDFSPYEPLHRELFGALRKAGWHPNRFVEFPDAAPGPDGEPSGVLILEDYAEAFLHSFYGLEVHIKGPYGGSHLSLGFGKQWQNMDFPEHGPYINAFAWDRGIGDFPYPVFGWLTLVGFITKEGHALAVNDTYQVYIRAENPFQLMNWALFRVPTPGVEEGYLERKYIPLDYKHLVWDRSLDYHLPKYRAYALTEGGKTEYVLECSDDPRFYGIRVTELKEVGSDLFVRYRPDDPQMSKSIATDLIVFKLLEEFFEGSFRPRIQLIHLTDERTGKVVQLTWPKPGVRNPSG